MAGLPTDTDRPLAKYSHKMYQEGNYYHVVWSHNANGGKTGSGLF